MILVDGAGMEPRMKARKSRSLPETDTLVFVEVLGEEAFRSRLWPDGVFSAEELRVLRAMLRAKLNSPLTTSAGRLFDGFASLLNLRHFARFEGQAAMELEFALGPSPTEETWPFAVIENGDILSLDWGPAVHAALREKEVPLPVASARFHNMLVAMGVEAARRVGEKNVVLSGGCFQNKYLTERFITQLQAAGFRPYWHQRVPPNDGGIALGQLMAAASRLQSGRD